MDKIKYEIIFKSGKVKNIVSKDINKVKNYITESFDIIKSVKRLDESKSYGFLVQIIPIDDEGDIIGPHIDEFKFDNRAQALKYARDYVKGYNGDKPIKVLVSKIHYSTTIFGKFEDDDEEIYSVDVKKLDEDTVKSKGYTVAIFLEEMDCDFDWLDESEIFKNIESAKEYATEQLKYHDSRKYYAFIYDTIIPERKRQHADDILNWTPIMVAEYKRHKVYFIDWK